MQQEFLHYLTKQAMARCNIKFHKKKVQHPPAFHKIYQLLTQKPHLQLQTEQQHYRDPPPWPRNDLREDTLYNLRQIHKQGKTVEFFWVPSHIQLHGNDAADQAAKEGLLLVNTANIGYCIREIYTFIKT
ncbi:hypothetical protein CHS0354_013009 [Potamilus streckersoni]|uniref:RNase H type-1 domain-containing protein n=1 Tax=Potamilus streckersoni TaxID=2493646 RepID=A0AAE0VGH6_9BIVA|nr:hypothetical protein CHS0354_013009 [Potamilus streckersoni]